MLHSSLTLFFHDTLEIMTNQTCHTPGSLVGYKTGPKRYSSKRDSRPRVEQPGAVLRGAALLGGDVVHQLGRALPLLLNQQQDQPDQGLLGHLLHHDSLP